MNQNNISSVYNFFVRIFSGILDFASSNSLIRHFLLLVVITTLSCMIIDFIFGIRDEFAFFNRFENYNEIKRFKLLFHRNKKSKRVDMDEIYQKSRKNADYKHALKMKEMDAFKENEALRYKHKLEEHRWYVNSKGRKIDKSSSAPVTQKKVNLDIEVED